MRDHGGRGCGVGWGRVGWGWVGWGWGGWGWDGWGWVGLGGDGLGGDGLGGCPGRVEGLACEVLVVGLCGDRPGTRCPWTCDKYGTGWGDRGESGVVVVGESGVVGGGENGVVVVGGGENGVVVVGESGVANRRWRGWGRPGILATRSRRGRNYLAEIETVLSEREGEREAADALAAAFAAQYRASLVGFDWPDTTGALDKVREETREVDAVIAAGAGGSGGSRLEEELGDLLFAVVNVARLAGVDPVGALASATRKFEGRFLEVERLARELGLAMPGTELERLDRLWDEVKAVERAG